MSDENKDCYTGKPLGTDRYRKAMKALDDVEIPLSGDFYDQLHDKIMAQIEQTQIEPETKSQVRIRLAKRVLRENWRRVLYSGTVGLALMVISFQSTQMVGGIWKRYQQKRVVQDSTVLELAANRAAYLGTIVGGGSSHDIFSSLDVQNEGNESDEILSKIATELITK